MRIVLRLPSPRPPILRPPILRPAVRRALLAAALAAAVVAATASAQALTAQPAAAATAGPGYSYRGDPTSHLGGFRNPDGSTSYCIDAAKPSPVGGVTSDQGVVAQVNGLSPTAMMQLGYVLGAHGDTDDDDTAAAVALVVWGLADPADHAARGGDAHVVARAPAAARAGILALAQRYRAEAAAYHPPAGEAQLVLALADDESATGTVDVAVSPSSSAGTLTLTGGVFADTGLATREVADGDRLPVRATPPSGARQYRVEAAAAFRAQHYSDGSVRLWTTPGAQTLASAGRPASVTFEAAAFDEVELPALPRLPRVAG